MAGKTAKFVGGILVLGVFGYGVFAMNQGKIQVPFLPTPTSELKAGTRVKLLTLSQLDSGKTKEDQTYPMVVAEDVKDGAGRVLIEAGTVLTGTITRSRGGSLAATLVNQPARLEGTFGSVKTIDGQSVPLSPSDKDPKAFYAFGKGSSTDKDAGDALQAIWTHPEAQKSLEQLKAKFQGEKVDIAAPDIKKILADSAKYMDLPNTSNLLNGTNRGSDLTQMSDSMDKVVDGNFKGMSGMELVTAAMALGEMGKLVESVDKTLRNTIKGRSISVTPGTPLDAYTTKTMVVKPK
jgi:hypothetical protein